MSVELKVSAVVFVELDRLRVLCLSLRNSGASSAGGFLGRLRRLCGTRGFLGNLCGTSVVSVELELDRLCGDGGFLGRLCAAEGLWTRGVLGRLVSVELEVSSVVSAELVRL